ncbi:hypothetical protein H6P81_011761 [Aristolochia fimbriata]|uniref:Uncharacterized protein n=1 Tax=Aristolochia fimbriata TaxID=158543 RepID=A0AAV7EA96_ARIFI|nr:hypothetical protein H6P81_011761 [Aristolochia fimbriata]
MSQPPFKVTKIYSGRTIPVGKCWKLVLFAAIPNKLKPLEATENITPPHVNIT